MCIDAAWKFGVTYNIHMHTVQSDAIGQSKNKRVCTTMIIMHNQTLGLRDYIDYV